MTDDVSELNEALSKVRAKDVPAAFAQGLRFASDSLRNLARPEVVVVSDGALDSAADALGPVSMGATKISFVNVGEGQRNVAITEFAVRRYRLDKSRYEVLIEVTNTGDEVAEVELELLADRQLTDIVTLTIGGGESVSRFYPNLAGADQKLEARVSQDNDLLPVDNHAYAILPERRRARVQVVSDGNMYLDAALLLDEYLEVVTVAPANYPAEGAFDVTIFDNVAPPRDAQSGHVFYLNPQNDEALPFVLGDELEGDAKYALGFDEVKDKHPIMRHLSLGDVNIAKARALEGDANKEDQALGKSFKGTLLLAGRREGYKFAALGFDVRDSDLPLRISWPLLLVKVIDDFLGEDVDYISSFRTGQVWRVPASPTAETATVKLLPLGEPRVVPIKEGEAVFLGQYAGFYELVFEDDAGRVVSGFAGNLSDVAESRIEPRQKLMVGESEAGELEGFTAGVRHEWWLYLLAVVIGITAIEWLTYHRRVTV